MIADKIVDVTLKLSDDLNNLKFVDSITHVYNPLSYAWEAHELYIRKRCNSLKQVLFLGMNPGPFGMAQTGVPFGEVEMVKNWVGVNSIIKKPKNEHPNRLIEGFNCKRSEVSGRRLWQMFQKRYKSAESFFSKSYVLNYCPLLFMEKSGKNFTPEKLPLRNNAELYRSCDEHLARVVKILNVKWVICIGNFAKKRADVALRDFDKLKTGYILHPSPANPKANSGWAQLATEQLKQIGVWS